MERRDVLIVGGGPAGSTLAARLAQSGLDVAVLDRCAFPRDKVCAGWITPEVVRALALDIEDYCTSRVLQPIRGFRVGLIGGREIETSFDGEIVSYGIRRCEFDHYLLERSGAALLLRQPFQGMEREGRDWEVNGTIRTPLVVGAGGHFCPVAQRLGSRSGAAAVVAQEVEFELTPAQRASCRVEPETPELYFCRDLTGYGWAFRKGDHINVGLGRRDPERLPEHAASFFDFLVRRGRVPADAPRKLAGHAYRLYPDAAHETAGDGVLLVGDAAGLAYPESGEGIRPAVESGLLAAEVILEAGGDYRRERLARYRERLTSRFGERGAGAGLAGWLPAGFKTLMAPRLLATEWFVRRVVLERWFLHRHVGALAG